jgi:hypothetical protein
MGGTGPSRDLITCTIPLRDVPLHIGARKTYEPLAVSIWQIGARTNAKCG